jgi:hypothetical protein
MRRRRSNEIRNILKGWAIVMALPYVLWMLFCVVFGVSTSAQVTGFQVLNYMWVAGVLLCLGYSAVEFIKKIWIEIRALPKQTERQRISGENKRPGQKK